MSPQLTLGVKGLIQLPLALIFCVVAVSVTSTRQGSVTVYNCGLISGGPSWDEEDYLIWLSTGPLFFARKSLTEVS